MNFGTCPHCSRALVLPAPGVLPLHCPYCGQAIGGLRVDPEAAAPARPDHPRPRPSPVIADADAASATQATATAHAWDDAAATPVEPTPESSSPSSPEAGATTEAGSDPAPFPPIPDSIQPGFSRPSPPLGRGLHGAIICGLIVLLGLQWLLADRHTLAADAHWRSVLEPLCAVLRCELPPWREPTALRMLERRIAADPARPGVLRVHARFRNEARWAQAWPQLQLTLSDASGRRLGARSFAPADYLGTTPQAQALIGSGQDATIAFDVLEPAGEVVSFNFDFR